MNPSSADHFRRGLAVVCAHEQQPDPFSSDDDPSPSPFNDSEHASLIRAIIDSQQLGAPLPPVSLSASSFPEDFAPHTIIIRAIIGPQQSGIAYPAVPSAASFLRFCFCSFMVLLLLFLAPLCKGAFDGVDGTLRERDT
jgi:hypothetical protein